MGYGIYQEGSGAMDYFEGDIPCTVSHKIGSAPGAEAADGLQSSRLCQTA